MPTPATILATKLYIPPPRPKVVHRQRLHELLDEIPQRKLTLISAPAGFGKTTLVGAWIAGCGLPAAWLSLDEGDSDPARFLTYLIAALQTVSDNVGVALLAPLQSPQPPPAETILAALVNELAAVPNDFVLVLDDYQVIGAQSIDGALEFLLEHLPPRMHLVITTREDPRLPVAKLRARGQLNEVRVADLRFTPAEAEAFLNECMGLSLAAGDVAALEDRTEGWAAGLQLAALSLRGQKDAGGFIQAFTGSHHFVLDYLLQEVLQQQPAGVQTFLLRTSVLDRLCGSLCDAVLLDPATDGQATLEYLERANLFIVPLDNERRWYRYHHLFADLLRQRAGSSVAGAPLVNELRARASQWCEDHDFDLEAFQYAAAARDYARAERLIEGRGIPLHFRGAVLTILDWLGSLPAQVLDARPTLWWSYASLLLVNGQTTGVDEKLDAAEAALNALGPAESADAPARNLHGQIATARATLALTRYQPEALVAQASRALALLPPANLAYRATANWALGAARFLQGDRAAARQALTEAIAISLTAKDIFTLILATTGLGNVQEAQNELHLAAETYRSVLHMAGDQPLQIVSEAHLGLARVLYEWDDLDGAERHAQLSLQLARQYDRVIDRFVLAEVFLARLKLARDDVAGAAEVLARTWQAVRQGNFAQRIPEVAAAQVLVLIRQGNLTAAGELAQTHALPLSQARVHLARDNPAAALAVLEPIRQRVDAADWRDERLKVRVLQALAHHMRGDRDPAGRALSDALALAAPDGFVRTFLDEGPGMARLLADASARGVMADYAGKLSAAFKVGASQPTALQPAELIDPLTERELEVLRLIAEGRSNREIGERLFLAVITIKGHNQNIFGKLQVKNRTEAVARARALGLLP